MTKKIIWTISGSDCSGGAGIAADIKTAHGLGLEICTLITANTVQNSQQLVAVNPVDVVILQQQFECLLEDKPPSVIKIGLLVNTEQVAWLCRAIKLLRQGRPELKVIYDPVGRASVGGVLSSLSRQDLLPLLSLIDVITPNIMEAQWLANSSETEALSLAQEILALGVKGVIIKGGHSQSNQCSDLCIVLEGSNVEQYLLTCVRIETHASHGGGCSFASALACFFALDYLLRDAFTLAKAYINQGLNKSAKQTSLANHYGAFEQLGWPTNKIDFPVIGYSNEHLKALESQDTFKMLGIKRGAREKLGLYPVVDSLAWLKRLLPLGLEIIQLRVKNLSEAQLELIIQQAVLLSKPYKTRLFINDYWQLAIKYKAYGVHIGQEDLIDADLSAIKQAGLRLGISTHGCYEFLLAQQLAPSYLAIGAIFPTKTKNMTGQIQGLDNLTQILTLATDIPVVAIGGINHERAPQVWQTGVDSVAVVTAITEAEKPEKSVADFQQLLI